MTCKEKEPHIDSNSMDRSIRQIIYKSHLKFYRYSTIYIMIYIKKKYIVPCITHPVINHHNKKRRASHDMQSEVKLTTNVKLIEIRIRNPCTPLRTPLNFKL